MNVYLHKIKKNWLPLALGLVVAVLLIGKSCDEARYNRDIQGLDKDIAGKEAVIEGLEKDVIKGVRRALRAEAVVAEKEDSIEASRLRIRALERREPEIRAEVMALPPSEMVTRTREILECAAVELTADGVLYSEGCARTVLFRMEEAALIKARLAETEFSLSESLEATEFQKQATAHVYGIAADLTRQIVEYKGIVKAKDLKFDLCEKQRKKGFWRGLKVGLAIGAGVTITITLVIPVIKAIF